MNKITKNIKIFSPLFLSFSVILTIFSILTKASAGEKISLYSEEIPLTILIAQDGTVIPDNNNTQAQNELNSETNFLVTKKDDQNTIPTFWGHILLTLGSGIIIGSGFIILNQYAKHLSKNWIDGIRDSNNLEFSVETSESPNKIHESIKKNCFCETRLKQQLSEIQIRISRHKELMLYFYRQHFISISMTSGLALIAGIVLIFIAEEGIGDANPALINIFITTSSAGLLYQRLPGIFKQELNREANRSLFLKYTDLGNTILSYAATGKIRDNTQVTSQSFSTQLDADKFIHFIDRELNRLNQLPIEFDATKIIKITDLQESINGAFNSHNAGGTPPGADAGGTPPGADAGDTTPGADAGDTTPGADAGDTTTGVDMENLQIDSSGQTVKLLQKRLQELGFYSGEIDGIFNIVTEEAVKTFQEEEGLAADGVVGLGTEEALDLDLQPLDIDVVQLQQRLSELEFYQGSIDGVWNQETIAAVKEFQKAEGLAEDGVVGMTTLEALDL